MGFGKPADDHSYNDLEKHIAALVAYKSMQAVVDRFASSKEPCNSWEHMLCFLETERQAKEVHLEDEDSIKRERQKVAALLAPLANMVTRVKDQRVRLHNSMTQKEKRDQKAAEEQKEQQTVAEDIRQGTEQKAKLEEQKRQSAIRISASVAPRTRQLHIFNTPGNLLKPLPKVALSDLKIESILDPFQNAFAGER